MEQAMGKQEISMEKTMTTKDVIAYLEQVVEGLKNGQLIVQKDDRILLLNPPAIMEVEVEAKQKKNKEKFSLELSWKTDMETESGDSLIIGSKVPETGNRGNE